MNKLNLVAIVLVSLAPSAYAGGGSITAALRLSPAGSFNAATPKVVTDFKKNASGKPAPFSVTQIKVKVDDLKTGISLRDQHLHKQLNAKKNPYITAGKFTFSGGSGKAELSLNGVTKVVPFTYKATPTGVSYQFKIVPTEFKIEKARYMGVGVKDEVEIQGTLAF